MVDTASELSLLPAGAEFLLGVQQAFEQCQGPSGVFSTSTEICLLDRWSTYGFSSVSSTMDAAEYLSSLSPEVIDRSFEQARIEDSGSCSQGDSLIIALEQSQGRGRLQRRWYCEPQSGMYLTYLLYPKKAPAVLSGLSLAVGLAVCEMMRSFSVDCGVKWPNDVLTRQPIKGLRRKLAGVLVEASSSGSSIKSLRVGIGVNINQQEFPADVPGVSMAQLLGKKVDYFAVLSQLSLLLAEVLDRYYVQGFSFFEPFWQSASLVEGARVKVTSGLSEEYLAQVRGVSKDGLLVVLPEDEPGQERELISAEVEFV